MVALRSKITLLSIGLGSLLAASTASAAVIVVRSVGPSARTYPAGKTLADSAKIELRSGDMVTLLNANSTRTVRGPGTFTAGSAGRAQLAMAANRRARFGALRAGDLPQNPSPWDVDVSESGKVCIADPAKLMLWRPTADEDAQISIRGAGGSEQTLDWAAGRLTLPWPAQLPVTDGAEYQVEWSGGAETTTVSFVKLAMAPTDPVGAAQTLIEKGCDRQLDSLVNGLEKEAPEKPQ